MHIYYCVTVAANIIAAIVFLKHINITSLSVVPLCLIALMVFQGVFFKSNKTENGFRTNYGSDLTADEENKMFTSGSKFLFATIPWVVPFVIFFPSFIKLLSIPIYIVGLIGGLVIYRCNNKSKIIARMNLEEKERREQDKKENN